MHKCKVLAIALAALVALLMLAPAAAQDPLGDYIVLSWNDLGMHCMNKDHSHLSILPPYNTQQAQVIARGDAANIQPRLIGDGVTLEYSIPGNTYSVGKTNFWSYEDQLFGVSLPDNIGLTGHGLTGSFTYHGPDWTADGIPITPFTDAAPTVEDPYQQALVILRDTQGVELHRSQPVIPVSCEISCVSSGCHGSESEILGMHEDEGGFDPANQPILCAQCHGSTPLTGPDPGTAGWFSRRIHHRHDFIDETIPGIAGCEKCHPGPTTHCLRDVMSTQYSMICQDCHGNMAQMANSIQAGRIPWLNEPACGTCHMAQFAEPAGMLFRNATGHGGVMCAACHHSPHAIWPSRLPRDNANAIALQGHSGALRDCSVCHGVTPTEPGPHGFTPSDIVETELLSGGMLEIYPSPLAAGGLATIRASRAGAEGGRLLVFDAQGRLVRLLASRVVGTEISAQWDGRSSHGERAVAGVYLLQWRDRAGSASGKLVLVD